MWRMVRWCQMFYNIWLGKTWEDLTVTFQSPLWLHKVLIYKKWGGLKLVLGSKPDEESHYLEHFAKRSISKLPNNFPNILRIDVSVNMFILLLLPIRPQLENPP